VVNDLRERATKGDDIDQLQKEAYTILALPAPPGTDMGNRRKANLLPEYQEEILSLNVGEVSKVEQEAFSFVVYKIDGKKLLPEEIVKDEISREISRQRLDNAFKEITGSIQLEFSEQYFGSAPISSSAGAQPSSTPMPH